MISGVGEVSRRLGVVCASVAGAVEMTPAGSSKAGSTGFQSDASMSNANAPSSKVDRIRYVRVSVHVSLR